jgi:hypothetical protein
MRASDQDREEAVRALTDQYAEGRLDHDEFELRMDRAQQATYLHDLDPLFVDLPARAGRGALAEPARSTPRGLPRGRFRPPLFLPLVVLTAVVLAGGHALWLLIPLWWIGLSLGRRRAWERRAWAHAQLSQLQAGHAAHGHRSWH